MTSFLTFALLVVAAVQASPTLFSRQSISSVLHPDQVNYFNPYAHLAAAAYCSSSVTQPWTCGEHCTAVPGFKLTASGGHDSETWFAGYESSLNSVIVVHRGKHDIGGLLTGKGDGLSKLASRLFPGVSGDIKVHTGFQHDHSKTAKDILSAVQGTMSQYNTTTVTTVGHSIGGAIALLQSAYFHVNLPQATSLRSVLYSLPRVGNKAWANYVDANLNVTHINNLKDPVPILPGKRLGYVHPSGEVHITDGNVWKNCPGQDNDSKDCIVGTVSNVFSGKKEDGLGPYNNIMMRCKED